MRRDENHSIRARGAAGEDFADWAKVADFSEDCDRMNASYSLLRETDRGTHPTL